MSVRIVGERGFGELYGLSDPALEAANSDRLSFRRFAGFSLDEEVPDHSTQRRFREDLRLAGLDRAVFEEINRQLDDRRLIMRKGTILDATLMGLSVWWLDQLLQHTALSFTIR